MGGVLGGIMQRAMQLEAALQLGFNITLSDVTAEEFAAVCILREERLRHEAKQDPTDGVQPPG